MSICHAQGIFTVTMHGYVIFQTTEKRELLKFVNNVIGSW